MTDEIMISRLADAHDDEMQRYSDETNSSSHWDEWMIDHRIDIYLEEQEDLK